MFKHLWVERGMLSGLTKKTCILAIVTNNKPILSSMLAAGIVQERLLLLPPGPEILPVS